MSSNSKYELKYLWEFERSRGLIINSAFAYQA